MKTSAESEARPETTRFEARQPQLPFHVYKNRKLYSSISPRKPKKIVGQVSFEFLRSSICLPYQKDAARYVHTHARKASYIDNPQIQEEDEESEEEPTQTQRRRGRAPASDDDSDGDEEPAGGDDMDAEGEEEDQTVKKMVRYALACEYQRVTIKRTGISEKG